MKTTIIKRKHRFVILLLISALLSTGVTFAQTFINTDLQSVGGPDVTYKRGVSTPGQGGFLDDQPMRYFLTYQRSIGMTIINGYRSLYADENEGEFYQNEAGVFCNKQADIYTSIRTFTKNLGFDMVNQISGVPPYSGYVFDPLYLHNGDAGDFRLPQPGFMTSEFQRNFCEWAINADKAVGQDYHSTWIGFQEPTHTLGFVDGIATTEGKKKNIERYVDFMVPIANTLRAADAKVGGIQLNSGNADLYDYAVNYMKQKNLQVDFLTFQLYQWGDTTDFSKAILAINSYNQKYPNTKIMVNRGGSDKIVPDNITDSGQFIYFLRNEKVAMNYADKIYSISLDRSVNGFDQVEKNTIEWLTKAWLNKMAQKRRPLTNLPDGVDGFLTSNETKVTAVLWNTANNTQNISLKLNNSNFTQQAIINVQKASGSTLTSQTVNWNGSTQTISGMTLAKDEFVLITIEDQSINSVSSVENQKVVVYPNPAKNIIHVTTSPVISLTVLTMDGRLVSRVENSTSMNVEKLLNGYYLLAIELDNGAIEYTRFLKSE